ncbi:hypothetical protein AVEN_142719-1 [Araneus ventricosus]|uniref:Uncharacterized protein n=1 Tax=Araneus ventricosus TaxID=182803 RepID=A0A4Y2IW72_ARAVE|nr:hypothetical protein AVEN_142719-1 [Araneus ventricosus]
MVQCLLVLGAQLSALKVAENQTAKLNLDSSENIHKATVAVFHWLYSSTQEFQFLLLDSDYRELYGHGVFSVAGVRQLFMQLSERKQ